MRGRCHLYFSDTRGPLSSSLLTVMFEISPEFGLSVLGEPPNHDVRVGVILT